jgi:hypothetical protein
MMPDHEDPYGDDEESKHLAERDSLKELSHNRQ